MNEPIVYLSIGANIKPRINRLKEAIRLLQAMPEVEVLKVASFYETEPWGNLNQPNFYNSAIALKTALTPNELLNALHSIEQVGHRTRQVHWGPRTIDLDIIFWGSELIQTSELIIPHPEVANRRFVLIPIVEISSHDPVIGPLANYLLSKTNDHSWIKRRNE